MTDGFITGGRENRAELLRLYTAVPIDYARHVYRKGFAGRTVTLYDPDTLDSNEPVVGTEVYCEFRDMPPGGPRKLTPNKQAVTVSRSRLQPAPP
jgi:hypothetical protein